MKDDKCKLHPELVSSLKANGFTKVMCPFGILMVATKRYPDELLKYGANLIANVIDSDNDGVPDDEDTVDALAHLGRKDHGYSLVCGVSRSEERKEENLEGLDFTFSCQTWKGVDNEDGIRDDGFRAIMFEEAFHMMNEGWSDIYPDIFGYDNFQDSLICRETASHQCVSPGWWHPENQCPNGAPFNPGNPASSPLSPGDGDCTDSSCDCFEFYRQAATLYMGWDALPFWYSDYMPTTKSEFEEMASLELLEMMANPIYNQPQSPLSGVYTKKGIRGTKGKSSGACRNNFKFRVDGDQEKSCKWVKQDPSTRCNENGATKACKKICDNCPCSW